MICHISIQDEPVIDQLKNCGQEDTLARFRCEYPKMRIPPFELKDRGQTDRSLNDCNKKTTMTQCSSIQRRKDIIVVVSVSNQHSAVKGK